MLPEFPLYEALCIELFYMSQMSLVYHILKMTIVDKISLSYRLKHALKETTASMMFQPDVFLNVCCSISSHPSVCFEMDWPQCSD